MVSGLQNSLVSQERILIQKTSKTAQKMTQKIIKREDIIPFSSSKQVSVSPKKMTEHMDAQQNNYHMTSDYDYQTPYKFSSIGKTEKTDVIGSR